MLPKRHSVFRANSSPSAADRNSRVNRGAKKTSSLRETINKAMSCEPEDSTSNPQASPAVKKAYRLVVLGSAKVGKSCIVNRFLSNAFSETYTPTIENFHRKIYSVRGELYQLDILDTSGNDPFPAARRLYLMTGDLFMIVYSVDNSNSYDEAFRLIEQICELKAGMYKMDNKCVSVPIVVVANKNDLVAKKRLVDSDSARSDFVQKTSCTFVECSAKSGDNIEEIFSKLFLLAKFPKELSPQLQKKLLCKSAMDTEMGKDHMKSSPKVMSKLMSKNSDPAIEIRGAEAARRPSLRTDLLLLRAKASGTDILTTNSKATLKDNTKESKFNSHRREKCVIQ